jgi:hypothetical protein
MEILIKSDCNMQCRQLPFCVGSPSRPSRREGHLPHANLFDDYSFYEKFGQEIFLITMPIKDFEVEVKSSI